MNSCIELATKIASIAYAHRSHDFVGLGFVVYAAPIDLPAVALGGAVRPALPVAGVPEIGDALARLSAHTSPWHDGFHFIELASCALTHVSQYLAPDLGTLSQAGGGELPSGARQLTALLVSQYKSAQCVALVSTEGDLTIYRHGQVYEKSTVRHA